MNICFISVCRTGDNQNMFQIELAGCVIRIYNHFSYIAELCKDYRKADACHYDLKIEISLETIQMEQQKLQLNVSLAYCESICVYREISLKLLKYHTMVMHSAVISCDGKGYAFCAKSGTGKSTHIALWKKVYGDRVKIINGDKPLVHQTIDSSSGQTSFIAYGTPWCGKENWGTRDQVPLNAICFIERGTTNSIRRMTDTEIIQKLFHQLLIPEEEELLTIEMNMVDSLIKEIPFYLLTCNMSEEAAVTAYKELSKI